MKYKYIILMLLSLSMYARADQSVIYKDNLKVLLVGNSYMLDATTHLKAITTASGSSVSNMCIYRLYMTSASYLDWVNAYNGTNTYEYKFSKDLGGLSSTVATGTCPSKDSTLFRQILTQDEWDLIVLQTSSLYAPYYDDWFGTGNSGYLEDLLDIIRTNQPNAKIGSFLLHSYWGEYVHNTQKSSYDRWQLIANSVKKLANSHGVDFIIPYGTAIQNLRASSVNNEYDLTRDGTQLTYGLGRYAAACCLYESLIAPRTGISVLGNSFRYTVASSTTKYPAVDVTDENAPIAQKAAVLAVENPYVCRNPEEAEPTPDNVSITVSSVGCGTYCSKFDLDFTGVDNLYAYIVTGYNKAAGKVILQRVYEVPAGTGLMVKGSAGTYTVPTVGAQTLYVNMLVGTTKEVLLAPTTGLYTNFVLSVSNGAVGFYRLSADRVMAANRAYLQLPTSITEDANSLGLYFEDEESDGITAVSSDADDSQVYTLTGARVKSPTKGVYIVGRKKVVVR